VAQIFLIETKNSNASPAPNLSRSLHIHIAHSISHAQNTSHSQLKHHYPSHHNENQDFLLGTGLPSCASTSYIPSIVVEACLAIVLRKFLVRTRSSSSAMSSVLTASISSHIIFSVIPQRMRSRLTAVAQPCWSGGCCCRDLTPEAWSVAISC